MSVGTRETLVNAAVELFYRDGYHATELGQVSGQAGVDRATLDEHFHSKDELILAALSERDRRFRRDAARELAARTDDPAERLVMVFDLLAEWFAEPDFSGCMFINATSEHRRDPIHAACAEHKRLFTGYLREQADAAGARDPQQLTAQVMLLFEGAITRAHVSGAAGAAEDARNVARLLVRQATTPAEPAQS